MTSAPDFSSHPHAPASHDLTAVESFAQALAAVDYSYDAVLELLGPGPFAALARDQVVPARRRVRAVLDGTVASRAGQRRLAGTVELFLLAGTTTPEALDATLGEGAFAVMSRLNLLEDRGQGRYGSAIDLSPHASDDLPELWVASDLGAHQRPGALPKDYVLGIGQASLTLAQTIDRSPVDRALDLGTGCGIQLFHLLAHARHVTATDVSERALAFTRFNLVLNARALSLDPEHLSERVELRRGSLLEPVAGESFDLLVSNPPFVITPRHEGETAQDQYTYRDGGLPGDQLVSTLVQQAPQVLSEGGRAQMLANWEILSTGPETQQEWDQRPRTWLGEQTEAWFIQREQLTPEQYAETWLQDAHQVRDQEGYEAAYADYLADFAARAVAAVGFGMVWLRRRPRTATAPALRRFEEITYPIEQPLGPHLARAVAVHDALAGLTDEALRELHLVVAEDVTEERHQKPGAEHPGVILLRQGAGLRRTELLGTETAGFVSACDGELSVGQICDALAALLGWEGREEAVELLGSVRALVQSGFLVHDGPVPEGAGA